MKKIKQLLKKRGPQMLAFISCFLVLISCLSLSAFAFDDSLLVSRKFKDNLSAFREFTGSVSDDDISDFWVENHFIVSPITIEGVSCDSFSPLFSINGDFIIILGSTLDDSFLSIEYNRFVEIFGNSTFQVLSTPNISVDEWLLANTVPVVNYSASITDVWTGIGNWIISSFGSVQGVFYDGTGTSIMTILNPESSFVYDGVTYYEPLDYLNVPYEEFYLDGLPFWSEGNTFEQITIDGIVYDAIIVGSSIAGLIDDANSIMYFNPAIIIGPPGGLTLLGTLALIGVSIALILLLIMVIRRFIALRS